MGGAIEVPFYRGVKLWSVDRHAAIFLFFILDFY